MLLFTAALIAAGLAQAAQQPYKSPYGGGTVAAVNDLLDRVLPGAQSHFNLTLADDCDGVACFTLQDLPNGQVGVRGTTASELTAAIGHYFRDFCNMTIGWPRGGGSNVFIPSPWPRVGASLQLKRSTPWSYMMNVCTHSYSLVWYSWADWQQFIDWMALNGVNQVLAMTGQEEVQYKVFQQFGLNDTEIRTWFNGPAFLTWSRGQNEYGNNICGALPRSFMQDQWNLQRSILARYRSLGIVGQLPGFQGNVPVGLKALRKDSNITASGGTGWMDSLDPLFGEIADVWMKTLIADFGTDSWYQLDGYFNGGTAPWYSSRAQFAASGLPVRPGSGAGADPVVPDAMAFKRGVAAYTGLNRTDPNAIWSFQGWAIIGWSTQAQAEFVKAFVDAAPPGKFSVIDMSTNGEGEWKYWNNASFFGANFIWTSLHDFGGTDGLKGNLAQANRIPFDALPPATSSPVWGTGFTPEGIDQNPVYYELLLGAPWRTAPVSDLTEHSIVRAHRRYGLQSLSPTLSQAWTLLVGGAYAQDLSVQDNTGVPHFPGSYSEFAGDRHTPSAVLCSTFNAWALYLDLTQAIPTSLEPFRYDLVNLGREVLAQLTVPISQNFSDAINQQVLDPSLVTKTGSLYVALLSDIDTLVGTESAFLLGSWLDMARGLAGNATDCSENEWAIGSCGDFYEWNARVQLTTWNPTPASAKSIPNGPIDYASKHWNGLIKDYYGARASMILEQALVNAAAKQPLDKTAVTKQLASLAYNWTTATNSYPSSPVGDAADVSAAMFAKYSSYFAACN